MMTAFGPINVAGMRLRNRIAMAPMTRSRAYGSGQIPTPLMATYYAQRTTAGLIIPKAHPATPGSLTSLDALELIEDGTPDMIAFASLFLTNPDLLARLAAGGPFNDADRASFYGSNEHGYTDYSRLSA